MGLLLEHGGLFVEASLGVLKAGRIQIPLETSFPRSRLSYMLEQSQATVLITDNANLPLAQEFVDLSVINIDTIDDSYSSANPGLVLASDRTGDLGSQDAEGCLFHHGRKDFQIKIRGYRVEIAEVEAAILEWDWIKEAVVVGWKDALDDNRLVAYLVSVAEPVPNVSELRRLLTKRLPDYMVPSNFVMLDALPLTATGKVDRRSLPAPKTDRPELETAYVSHRNLVEENLARIWAEVLGVDRVGIHDTFLELGEIPCWPPWWFRGYWHSFRFN